MRCSPPDSPAIPAKLKPRKRQTLAELRDLQRLAGGAIMRSLDSDFQMQKTWDDGRDTQVVIAEFIKPNDRLTSFERLEIYNRQYWFRLIDSVYDDFPGLLAILGNTKFSKLVRGYLAKYPSRSFTMRNMGSRMPQFLAEEPRWASPYEAMASDMAKFEWAQITAFDDPARPALTTDDLLGKDPARLRMGLQPYIALLDMAYPLDQFSLAVKKQGMRAEASNAMEESGHDKQDKKIRRPRARRTWVAIHRLDNDLYYKSLKPAAYRILCALRDGATLAAACEAAGEPVSPEIIGQWFTDWMALGWFCKR